MYTALGLNRQQNIAVSAGGAWLHRRELTGMPEHELRAMRGGEVGMVFQNPATALNPIMTIGGQVAEAVRAHHPTLALADVAERVLVLLRQVQMPDPEGICLRYPHELSGGQRQRVVIAMAIANAPSLIVADEPTTALDVTVQAQVLDLFRQISARPNSSMVMITHDLGVVAETADRVAVMYYGRVVESGPVEDVFATPTHPYTRALLASIPRLERRIDAFRTIPGTPPRPGEIQSGCPFAPRCSHAAGRPLCTAQSPELRIVADGRRSACHFAEDFLDRPLDAEEAEAASEASPIAQTDTAPALLSARGIVVRYGSRQHAVTAVRGVDLALKTGRSLGIVGESGCGKSSLLRALIHLPAPQEGIVEIGGRDIAAMGAAERCQTLRDMQIVQQDPSTALDRRMSVLDTVREPLDIHRIGTLAEREAQARDYLSRVGIGPDLMHRRPAMLSGGQQQRVAIARALVLHPRVLLLDKAFSALDISVRAQVLNLLTELRKEFGLTYLFVSHDLSIIRSVADEIVIMYLGRIVEQGTNQEVFEHPQHPYTQALLAAIPVPDPRVRNRSKGTVLAGDPPDPARPPSGCAFRTRCPRAHPQCVETIPALERRNAEGGQVACLFPG